MGVLRLSDMSASQQHRSSPAHACCAPGKQGARTELDQLAQRRHDKGHQARARRHERPAPLGAVVRRELAAGALRAGAE